jgi:hypothetical protein
MALAQTPAGIGLTVAQPATNATHFATLITICNFTNNPFHRCKCNTQRLSKISSTISLKKHNIP